MLLDLMLNILEDPCRVCVMEFRQEMVSFIVIGLLKLNIYRIH